MNEPRRGDPNVTRVVLDRDEYDALVARIALADRVIEAADDVRCYPEGAVGFEVLNELIAEWRKGQNTASGGSLGDSR